MKTGEKLERMHSKVVLGSSRIGRESYKSQTGLDSEEMLEIIEEAVVTIHNLKGIISTIKELVEGVKWYEFLKLASIVKRVIELVKSKNWDI
jgi:hypothetical protein